MDSTAPEFSRVSAAKRSKAVSMILPLSISSRFRTIISMLILLRMACFSLESQQLAMMDPQYCTAFRDKELDFGCAATASCKILQRQSRYCG